MHRHKAAIVIVASLLVGAVPLYAQTLGELARRAEESRKAATKGTKTYTNSDAGNVPAATVTSTPIAAPSTPTPPPTAQAGQSVQTPGQTPAQGTVQKDQAYWGGRLKELQTQLDRDIAFRSALQVQINSLTTDFVNRDDPAQRSTIEQERNRALAELDRLAKAVETDSKAIADFEEEARRAGVPPGWLR